MTFRVAPILVVFLPLVLPLASSQDGEPDPEQDGSDAPVGPEYSGAWASFYHDGTAFEVDDIAYAGIPVLPRVLLYAPSILGSWDGTTLVVDVPECALTLVDADVVQIVVAARVAVEGELHFNPEASVLPWDDTSASLVLAGVRADVRVDDASLLAPDPSGAWIGLTLADAGFLEIRITSWRAEEPDPASDAFFNETLGGEVAVNPAEDGPEPSVVEYGDAEALVISTDVGATLLVSAPTPDPRTFVVTLRQTSGPVRVWLDDERLEAAENVAEVIDARSDEAPEYWAEPGPNGTRVYVSLPEMSTHEIRIEALELSEARNPLAWLEILAAVGVAAALTLGLLWEPPQRRD